MARARFTNPCRVCGDVEAVAGDIFCADCEPKGEGPLPKWVGEWWRAHGGRVEAEHATWKEMHARPLLPDVRFFGELFHDFEPLPRAIGSFAADHIEKPVGMPFGDVSRYCSTNFGGRHAAMIVLPGADLLHAVSMDPLMMRRVGGISWTIIQSSPTAADVHYLYQRILGQRLVARITAQSVPRPNGVVRAYA